MCSVRNFIIWGPIMNHIDKIFANAIIKKEIVRLADYPEKAGHLAFVGTANYLVHTGITMTSVLLSNPDFPMHFHLFINGIECDDKEKLTELANQTGSGLTLYYVDDGVFKDMLLPDGIASCFYRFVIPSVLWQEQVKQVLCLDSDLMCQGSLRPLLEMDLEGKLMAGVEDTSPEIAEKCKRRVGTQEYFNAGVMLIDIEPWMKEKIGEKAAEMAIERVRSGAKYTSHDQDIFNILLDGKFKMAERKYNYVYNLEVRGLFKHQPPLIYDPEAVLVHFAAYVKPWRTWVQGLPGVQKYNEYRLASLWRECPLEGIKKHKDAHQAARWARKRGQYLEALRLYRKYYEMKLCGRK